LLLCIISLAVLVASCGPRWAYNNLDWIIPWYIEDYVPLDAQQNDELSARLAYQLDWHCRTQMNRYADFLRQLRDDQSIPGRPIPAERWAVYFEQLRQYWIDLVYQVGPDAMAILVTASDAQIDTLFANIEKTNLELEDEYVDPPLRARRQNRKKRMHKRIDDWTGPLTRTQQDLVAQWADGLAETAEEWMAHRRRFQMALRRRLAQRRPGKDFERQLLDLFAAPEKLRTASFQEKIDTNMRLTFILLENLSRSLTPMQRRHFVGRLGKLANELEQLACDPTPGVSEKPG
jgi:hypothetical protein